MLTLGNNEQYSTRSRNVYYVSGRPHEVLPYFRATVRSESRTHLDFISIRYSQRTWKHAGVFSCLFTWRVKVSLSLWVDPDGCRLDTREWWTPYENVLKHFTSSFFLPVRNISLPSSSPQLDVVSLSGWKCARKWSETSSYPTEYSADNVCETS